MYDVFRRSSEASTALKMAARERPDWLMYFFDPARWGAAHATRCASSSLKTGPQHLVAMMISSRGILYYGVVMSRRKILR